MSRFHDDAKMPILLDVGACTHESPKAVRVQLDNGEDLWIPKSVLHDDSEVFAVNDRGKVVVHQWWAESRGDGPAKGEKRILPMKKTESSRWQREKARAKR